MKVVVLTSTTPGNVWLVNQILGRFNVVGIVIERRPLARTRREKYDRRWQMAKRHGVIRTVNKLLYNRLRSVFFDSRREMVEGFFSPGATIEYSRAVPKVTVQGINDPQCAEFIKRNAPDVLAVCGTGVIRPEIFLLAPQGALNIHTGITPEYRSADPIFWALYRGEPHKVGVTIHFIDPGIDSGPVVHQEIIPVYAEDSLASLYVRCVRRGAALYVRALSELQNGTIRTIDRSAAEDRVYRSIDLGLIEYIRFVVRFRKMAKRLPSNGSGTAPQRASGS